MCEKLKRIYRPKGQKFCESQTPRLLSKQGRKARMFAKNRTKNAGLIINLSKVDYVITEVERLAQIKLGKQQLDSLCPPHKPIGGKFTPNTVRAKQKLKRGVRELIRI